MPSMASSNPSPCSSSWATAVLLLRMSTPTPTTATAPPRQRRHSANGDGGTASSEQWRGQPTVKFVSSQSLTTESSKTAAMASTFQLPQRGDDFMDGSVSESSSTASSSATSVVANIGDRDDVT
ncbi:hypothetical protein SEVIR_3G216775v4 [Setaria viridis]|uniref:Uncharacterized protein n=1 Tax=Setaria viridis TaxID=4556 RepID=A0A4V6D9P9_SETVI|nr:hypothetical protein SEVIR_3G216775v2 [Setaria viridis]